MSIVSSNMISKHYCPKCHSFDLFKLHRSFVEKRILGSENKFQCKSCEQVFKPSVFESNIPKEVPVFIDQIQQRPTAHVTPPLNVAPQEKVVTQDAVVPKVAVEDPIVAKAAEAAIVEKAVVEQAVVKEAAVEVKQASSSTLSKASSKMMLNGDFMSEDNFKVTETVRPKAGEQQSVKKPKVRKAPPAHNGGEQFVDEPIITTERKSVWPYAVGSAMVLLGAAYAFVWMPLASNASTSEMTQMDMSIGSPGQVWSDKLVNTASILPEVVNVPVSDSDAAPIGKSDIQIKLEEIALGKSDNDSEMIEQPKQALLLAKADLSAETSEVKIEQEIVKTPLEVKTPSAIADAKSSAPESDPIKVIDFKLKHNIGTKADNALGGLSLAKKTEKVPAAPSASTPVVTEAKPSQVATESNNTVDVPLPETSVRQYVVKTAVTPPVLKAVNEPAEVKTVMAKPRKQSVKKSSISSDSQKLLEQAAVKLMQQDLDKLF